MLNLIQLERNHPPGSINNHKLCLYCIKFQFDAKADERISPIASNFFSDQM